MILEVISVTNIGLYSVTVTILLHMTSYTQFASIILSLVTTFDFMERNCNINQTRNFQSFISFIFSLAFNRNFNKQIMPAQTHRE